MKMKIILLLLISSMYAWGDNECELKAAANYYSDFGTDGHGMNWILQTVNALPLTPGPNDLKNLLLNIYEVIAIENTKYANELYSCN